jgi:hypothetical protein
MLPGFVPDRNAYQGDDYTLTLKFWTDATKTTPVDFTGSTFSAELGGEDGVDVAGAGLSINDAAKATGVIVLTLDGDDSALIDGPHGPVIYLRWSLTEAGNYDRTLLEGRVALKRSV